VSKPATSSRYAGKKRQWGRWLLPAALLLALVGAWQLAASSGALADLLNLESFLVPSPAEILESLWRSRALLAENAWVTLREMLLGLGCAVVAGLALAVVMHLWEALRRAAYPLIVISQTIPIIVIAPILVIWFGYGIGPKLWIIALICFFPITVNALDGLRSVDPEATKMMRTLDASRGQILWRLEAPTSLPYVFTGAKVAVAVAAIGAVFAEWAGSNSGLGHLILVDNGQLETARVFAATLVLGAMTIALYALLALAERRIVTWR
jgi:NitT/TauT family transport system permease protein/putative hydroxymethylpyrimidine transport system permease protein